MNAIRRSILGVLAASAASLSTTAASAQCFQWESAFSTEGFDGEVRALAVYRPCSAGERSLYAGGSFTTAGGVPATNVARWNGSDWSAVGAGLPGAVYSLCAYDDGSGSGPALYAGGAFPGTCNSGVLAKWNGTTWTMVCDPDFDSISGPVETMIVYAGSLYLGGVFDYSIGGGQTFGSSLLRYDGQDLTPLCCVFGQTFLYGVKAFQVFDRGSGAELVVAGEFTNPANGIASWNGSTWSAFGSGLGGFFNPVTALAVFNPGSGAELYAGLGAGVVRWNGTSWSSIGASDAGIESLFSYSDGTPTMLYTGGRFSTIGGVSASRIARWDGSAWATVGNGVTAPATNASVLAMTSFDDHSAGDADLYIAGSFAEVGGVTSPNIAEWSACGTLTGTAFCFGDGSLATPCPCAAPNVVPNPAAALRHGCANSFNFDGAQLYASGSTANDGVQFMTSGQTPFGFSFFIVGTAQDSNGVASADGVRCVDGALTRFGSQFAACGSVVYPNSLVGWTAPVSVVSGATPGSGLTKYYQVYYRNAAANFCTGATTNFTSAYRLVW